MNGVLHRDYAGAKLGMWLFLFTELFLFGGLLLSVRKVGHEKCAEGRQEAENDRLLYAGEYAEDHGVTYLRSIIFLDSTVFAPLLRR